MRNLQRIFLRAQWLIVLLALATLPAWAQQIESAARNSPSRQPSATTTQPLPIQSAPETNIETPQQTSDDAQLPAYLQDNSKTEANSTAYDPWEHYNRNVYHFNKKVDKAIAKPLALAYIRVVPQPVRIGVSHFCENLRQPITAVNLLLQGHPGSAGNSLGRFAVNTALGIGGVFDPATKMHIPRYNEDFGQTLGRWGWRRSRYFLLPFFGPGTVRDRIGSLTDAEFLGPYKYFQPIELRVGLVGLSLIDTRVRILPLDELSAGIDDDYLLVREAWTQRRMHQIDDQTVNLTDQAARDSLKRYDFPEDHQANPTPMPQAPPADSSEPVKH